MSTPIYLVWFNVAASSNGLNTGFITIPAAQAALTAIGATVNINDSTNTRAASAIVTDVNTTTGVIGLRLIRNEQTIIDGYQTYNPNYQKINYGRSDLSAYTTANTCYIIQNKQVLYANGAGDDSSGKSGPN